MKDLKDNLVARATSPIYGPFIISWSLWNWKVVLYILATGLAVDQKIENIRISSNYFDGLIFPLASAAIYIFLMPFVMVKFGHFVNYYKRLENIRDHEHELKVQIDKEFKYTTPYALQFALVKEISYSISMAKMIDAEISNSINRNHGHQTKAELDKIQASLKGHINYMSNILSDNDKIGELIREHNNRSSVVASALNKIKDLLN